MTIPTRHASNFAWSGTTVTGRSAEKTFYPRIEAIMTNLRPLAVALAISVSFLLLSLRMPAAAADVLSVPSTAQGWYDKGRTAYLRFDEIGYQQALAAYERGLA